MTGSRAEAVGVHDKLAVLQRYRSDLTSIRSEQVLTGKKRLTGNVDTVGVLEVTGWQHRQRSRAGRWLVGLALLISGDGLLVGNDLHLELVLLNNTLDSLDVHPDVVGVEVLELLDGLELVDVLLGDLSDFQQADLALGVNDGTTLDIGLGLVGQLHDVLSLGVNHVLQDAEIDNSAEVVSIGKEDVSMPRSMSWSRMPELYRDSKTSP